MAVVWFVCDAGEGFGKRRECGLEGSVREWLEGIGGRRGRLRLFSCVAMLGCVGRRGEGGVSGRLG